MAELKPCPCPLCGSRLKKKKTVRGEIVYDHPWNGCKEEGTRVREYAVDDWNRRADNDKAPTADVVKVVHGEWIDHTHTMMECSCCKRHTARHRFEFCPHCGAKMDGERKEVTP